MELQLTFLILLPLIGSLLEATVSRFFNKSTGYISIFVATLTLFLAIVFAYAFDYDTKSAQFIFNYPWIQGWGINFKLALDGISAIGVVLVAAIFLITTILSKSDNKNNFFYVMLMILEATILGFIMSYDFVLKIFFWEAAWIPVFLLLVTSAKKHFAVLYSKYWFLSELLIIIASILLFNSTSMSYDLEKISAVQLGSSKVFAIIFFLFIIGIWIRISIFPFDNFINKSIQNFDNNISILISVLMPILPFLFLLNVLLPVFVKEFNTYTNILAIVALASLLICLIRLFIDKKLSTIISTQIIIFNALTFIWLIKPSLNLLNATVEIIVVKTILNILIIYFGRQIILKNRDRNPLDLWMFIIPLIFSFGIPGLLIIKPLFTLISSWYGIAPYVSISICVLLTLGFLYTSINVAPLFKSSQEGGERIKISINAILLLIGLLATVSISIFPYYLHNLSENYYKTYLSRGR